MLINCVLSFSLEQKRRRSTTTTTTTTALMMMMIIIIITTAETKIRWWHDSYCCQSVLPQRRSQFLFFLLSSICLSLSLYHGIIHKRHKLIEKLILSFHYVRKVSSEFEYFLLIFARETVLAL